MLRWAILCLVMALIAGILGLSHVEVISATIAEVLAVDRQARLLAGTFVG